MDRETYIAIVLIMLILMLFGHVLLEHREKIQILQDQNLSQEKDLTKLKTEYYENDLK